MIWLARRYSKRLPAATAAVQPLPLEVLDEFPHSDIERISNQFQRTESHALLSAFEPVEMCAV